MPPLPPCIIALAALSAVTALCFLALAAWHQVRFDRHSRSRGDRCDG